VENITITFDSHNWNKWIRNGRRPYRISQFVFADGSCPGPVTEPVNPVKPTCEDKDTSLICQQTKCGPCSLFNLTSGKCDIGIKCPAGQFYDTVANAC